MEVGILVCPTINIKESDPKAGFLISLLVIKSAIRETKANSAGGNPPFSGHQQIYF